MASNVPLRIFTDRLDDLDDWLHMIVLAASRPIAAVHLSSCEKGRSPYLVPYYTDYGNVALYIDEHVRVDFDVYDLVAQAQKDKFRAVYLLDGKQDVMLFRNKYCGALTKEYVESAPIEELRSLKWAGAKENIGMLTLTRDGVA
jgi:hypothetical protein